MGAKTSARSTRPSSIGIGWCHVIFMPSRISVRALTSGNSLMASPLRGPQATTARPSSATPLRTCVAGLYDADGTLTSRRTVGLVVFCALLATVVYFLVHDCAVGGAMGGRYRDCRCGGLEWPVFDHKTDDGPRRTLCLGLVAERTCYRHREGPVVPCMSRAER